MGGSAFAADRLYTPRMSEVVYRSVQERVESTLRAHFKYVGHAIEAPAKTSHGDIDVLVATPIHHIHHTERHAFLATAIGADMSKNTGATTHAALRWPDEYAGLTVKAGNNFSCKGGAPYIQVDIHVCPTLEHFNWFMFFQAHGDLWNMLGGIVRRFGLTPTSNGLCLRIAETEMHNKEQSRVRMTDDPTKVLQYLGLDTGRYWQPFDTWDEMMAYAASSRFHDPARWSNKREDLKANDRQRASKRPAFGYWVETYLPTHQDDAPGKDAYLTREDVIEDAKSFFGPEFASQFDAKRNKLMRQISVDKFWADLRKSLPLTGVEIGYVMKGMKREIAGQDQGEQPELQEVRRAYMERRYEDILEWVTLNWKEVGDRQKQLDQEKSHQQLMAKGQRDKEKMQNKQGEGLLEKAADLDGSYFAKSSLASAVDSDQADDS